MYQQSFLDQDSFLNRAFLNRGSTVLESIKNYHCNFLTPSPYYVCQNVVCIHLLLLPSKKWLRNIWMVPIRCQLSQVFFFGLLSSPFVGCFTVRFHSIPHSCHMLRYLTKSCSRVPFGKQRKKEKKLERNIGICFQWLESLPDWEVRQKFG